MGLAYSALETEVATGRSTCCVQGMPAGRLQVSRKQARTLSAVARMRHGAFATICVFWGNHSSAVQCLRMGLAQSCRSYPGLVDQPALLDL